MDILFVSHKYPPAVGGMEKQSQELISGMSSYAKVHTLVYSGQESRLKFFMSLERRIRGILAESPEISIIHFNDALIGSVCLRHKSYTHLYRTVTVHGLDVVFPSSIYQKFILPAFNRFDLIIAVSRATAKACVERGIAQRKVVVIPNGVDHELLETQPSHGFPDRLKEKYGIEIKGKTVLLALGRPVKRKGISWFLGRIVPLLEGDFIFLIVGPYHQARPVSDWFFSCLPRKMHELFSLFLGYPADENSIRGLLSQSRFENKAVHLGRLGFDDLKEVLAYTDALVMPNLSVKGDMEGFGLVGLEASLCGAWVFASDIDGIPDAIHANQNGTLLAAGDEKAWPDAVNDFILNPDQRLPKERSKNYSAGQFSWNKMTAAYLENFSRLLENRLKQSQAEI